MKWIIGGLASAMLIATAACSGGGSGGGGSSSRKGTGYLKVDLPVMTGASASSLAGTGGVFRPQMSFSTTSVGHGASQLKLLITNTNSGTDCIGVVESIPFLVCMVESMGINKPGTYSGALGGVTLTAVVTELTADPDGYEIEAVVTKAGNDIFNYKANTAGTKGEIRYEMLEFFAIMGVVGNPDDVQDRANILKWDNTDSQHAIVETWEEFHSNFQNTSTTKWVSHMKAFIDEDNGIADIVSKQSSKQWRSLAPEAQVDTFIIQTRVKGSHVIEAYVECTEAQATESAVTLGTTCWDFSKNNFGRTGSSNYLDWQVHHYQSGMDSRYPGDLVGGTFDATVGYTHIAALNMTPPGTATLQGTNNWTVPVSGFSNTALDAVLSAQRAGSEDYSFEVDTNQTGHSATAKTIAKLAQDVLNVDFADMDALVDGK